ncbi:MAG: hypothetical protein E7449_05725 [Ruminococcaceae bacterium]|nr:hypothetical protein [Oscillospiraceae bacterium]
MKKFYSGVVRRRKLVLAVFAVLFVLCFFLEKLVYVNYDINDYLPDETHSTVSLNVMSQEFSGGIPNCRVMIRDVTIPEVLDYIETIQAVEGVIDITWLDDQTDITVPLAALDSSVVEPYYKDGTALLSVTIDEEYNIPATEAIRSIVGDENAISGTAASIAVSTTNTLKEIPMISAIAVAITLVMLLLTTTSWVEPIVILMGIGVAIILNGGTNLMFGEISFITNASGSILLLAVSLDYSVFLIHRFDECRKETTSVEEAMVEALCKATSSILSSGLTTVIGFLALVLMQFEIGPNLGLALAKGVGISLITVFLFVPSLVMSTYSLMDKTRHRSFMPSFRGLGKLIRKATIPFVCIFAIVLVPAYLASNANEFYYGASEIFGEDTQYGADTAAIDEMFGISDTYVLLVPKGDTATQKALSDDLHQLDYVTGIISFVDAAGPEVPYAYLDEQTLALLESEHYTRMVIEVSVPTEGRDTFRLVEQIREAAGGYYPDDFYLAGRGVSTYDLMDTITADMLKVNLLAIGAVFLVLLLAMRSLILPIILVLGIETAIWINLAIPYFAGESIFYIAYLIISAIQLGATVDYAILMTNRYRENRQTLEKNEALVQTISDTTVSILTSGGVMTAVGLLMGVISSNRLLAQLGVFIGRGALLSLAIVFFVLPGLLYLFDKWTGAKTAKKDNILTGGNAT